MARVRLPPESTTAMSSITPAATTTMWSPLPPDAAQDRERLLCDHNRAALGCASSSTRHDAGSVAGGGTRRGSGR
jgi:hypothetical protein